MNEILKKPYEISIWEDVLVFLVEYYDEESKLVDTREYEHSLENFEEIEGTTTQISQYYKEQKLCIIGSDTLDSPVRAIDSKLVRNVNGSKTLTFSMYSKYYDEEQDEFIQNPFLNLLVNERKVKLRYGTLDSNDCKWYDLIIKKVEENSENSLFTYTAIDQFINELSKSGFDIELDSELENNIGNIVELGRTVLEGSDWEVAEENSLLKQYKEEPLYKITVGTEFTAKNMEDLNDEKTLNPNAIIYAFYNSIINEDRFLQFLYVENGNYKIDDDHIITNSPNYYLDDVEYIDGKPTIAKNMTISSEYRGKRLVRKVITKYDSTIDKYVNVYEKDGETYYGYSETEYISPISVQNFVTNPNNFTSTTGWQVGGTSQNGETIYPSLNLQGYPDLRDVDDIAGSDIVYTSYLNYYSETNGCLFNSGVADYRSQINNLTRDEKYVFRIKAGIPILNAAGRPTSVEPLNKGIQIPFKIATYNLTNGIYTPEQILFEDILEGDEGSDVEFIQKIVDCRQTMSYSDLVSARIGIFIYLPAKIRFYLQDVQFFKYLTYIKDGEEKTQVPGGELFSETRTKYFYYMPNEDYQSIEDVQYIYIDYTPSDEFDQVYNENAYEKIRSIKASESNRFNLIQDLCEIFECWPNFIIEHNEATGEILLGKDKWPNDCPEEQRFRQQKYISFQEYIGTENFSGFKYGINLKSIQRTLDSEGIVSKLVVKDNSNEFGEGGFCSISRAQENFVKENFIYDFSYYIQQGLVTFSEINNDLYLDSNGYLGYYKKLRTLNQNRDAWIEELVGLKADISNYEASYQTYEASVNSAEEELQSTEQAIIELTGFTYTQLIDIYKTPEPEEQDEEREQWLLVRTWWENEKLINLITKCSLLRSTITNHGALKERIYGYLHGTQTEDGEEVPGLIERYEELEASLSDMTRQKRELSLKFYKKYSRFIQEGSWISEDYIDDNLYFLDAESTLHTSSQPKVTYNINVLELSQIEEYQNYTFNLGDKTYIEDTEFFGWVWQSGFKTPYHEEIIVTEITNVLDSPENNTIKVQNYKNQFEDLFQRMAAATQTVEYSSGKYAAAASVVEDDGTISIVTLQNSIANNALTLSNVKDQSVVWDEQGITTTCLSNPSQIVRIVSGGIFMSIDGGLTWTTGITAQGMNASYLTTGQVYTNKITILNGNISSFRWDELGLNAFKFSLDANGRPYGFDQGQFVRFDQYGIYGIEGDRSFNPLEGEGEDKGEKKIWNNAKFALTWKGFMLKNRYGNGYVSIDSEEDFVVVDSEGKRRIKIGNIGSNDNITYGIRIRDDNNNVVMETKDDGTLWLKHRLNVESSRGHVAIGKLDEIDEEHGNRVIESEGDGEESFVVYEDGHIQAVGGEFVGIKATNGEFTGKIEAEEGEIGGFLIGTNELKSRDESLRLVSSDTDGASRIFVENINLGIGATIEKYIEFNDADDQTAYIFNPSASDINIEDYAPGVFIKAGALKLTTAGFIQLGNNIKLDSATSRISIGTNDKIVLDGTTTSIRVGDITLDGAGSRIFGDSFTITPSLAEFTNISCSGKITTAVFEKGRISSVGGSMFFKPSYKIESAQYDETTNLKIVFESDSDSEISIEGMFGHYVLLIDKQGKILNNRYYKLISENEPGLTEDEKIAMEEGKYTYIFREESEGDVEHYEDIGSLIDIGDINSISIAINSNQNHIGNLLRPEGLTISEFKAPQSLQGGYLEEASEIRAFLGNLSTLGIPDIAMTGFGLYSDNVYLRGSLISQSSSGVNAGINTNSQIYTNDENSERIILWAGAEGKEDNDIQNAAFRVTEEGSVYARKGNFSDSILANSKIIGAEIQVAKITSRADDPALAIYDTDKGIIFKRSRNNDDEQDDEDILTINSTEFKAKNFSFITLGGQNEDKVHYKGCTLKLEDENSRLSLFNNRIRKEVFNNIGGLEAVESEILLGEELTFKVNERLKIQVTANETNFNNQVNRFSDTVNYAGVMEYQKVTNGYNLYVG